MFRRFVAKTQSRFFTRAPNATRRVFLGAATATGVGIAASGVVVCQQQEEDALEQQSMMAGAGDDFVPVSLEMPPADDDFLLEPTPIAPDEIWSMRTIFDNPSVATLLYRHLSEAYYMQGQLEIDEAPMTVEANVFSQIGVLTVSGVREMCLAWLGDAKDRWERGCSVSGSSSSNSSASEGTKEEQPEEDEKPHTHYLVKKHTLRNGESPYVKVKPTATSAEKRAAERAAEKEDDEVDDKSNKSGEPQTPLPLVFCDIGSGVGNVCLQVLAEVPLCSKVVGIEVIPSRHRAAVTAYDHLVRMMPCIATGEANVPPKTALFEQRDLVGCQEVLQREGVNVVFTHSWMFDDDLMTKLADVITHAGPQLQFVVTSRPFEKNAALGEEWELEGVATFEADWNKESPFFMYKRKAE